MADNTFTDDITDAAPAADDAVESSVSETSAPQDNVDLDKSYEDDDSRPDDMDDLLFEWEDANLLEARVYRPYTPPLANEYIPLVITASKLADVKEEFLKDGDFPKQIEIEAEHLSTLYGDKSFPYRVYLNKKDDRNPKRVKTPMATAFLATGVIVKDGAAGKKSRPLPDMVEELDGREFISRVYFQEKQAKTSIEVEAYWGPFGTICNGDGEILKETDKKSTEVGKVLYFNPLSGVEKYTGDVFCDADGDPVKSSLVFNTDTNEWEDGGEEVEVTFGINHPMLNEDMNFGKPGTRITDSDGDKVTVHQRTTVTYEKIDGEFHAMPDRVITVAGVEWLVSYETVVNLMPPVKPNKVVIAYNPENPEEEIVVKYGFDGTWAQVELPEGTVFHPTNHGEVVIKRPAKTSTDGTADPEDAGFNG